MPGTPPTRFTYLGPAATFAEQALRTVPAAARAELVPSATVAEAIAAVRSGDADAAFVPLENSVEGAVGATMDELAAGDPLVITREVLLAPVFGCYVRAGTDLADVKTFASHPHGEAQCRRWVRENLPQATFAAARSTADAAAGVAGGEYDAAVCAPVAGERYRLTEVGHDIADNTGAVTRFVLLSRPAAAPPRTGDDVTSLVAYIAHDRTGALLEVLTEFAVRGINLTRIESRPTKEQLGRYCFFLDCTGHVGDARIGEALMGLRRICADLRYLGSYPRAGQDGPHDPPPGTSDEDFADAAAWLARVREGGV
ncbi:MAG: prephenate dehydratase [Actinomycetia bacterium]|jgi:prephenate dehydratase|nr:prephenate dehydratase [Actinomycetes bacterium]